MASRRPLIVAHRGASAELPDNSPEAFAEAIRIGADLIELDVRRTRDGALIAQHDPGVGGIAVSALTHAELARRLGRRPPLLDEVLELARGRIGLDVELKEDGYVEAVVARLDAIADPLLVTSFSDRILAEVRRAAPALRTGLLLGRERPPHVVRTRLSELFPTRRARACGASHVAPHVRLTALGGIGRASRAGLPALVWTVNDDRGLRRLLADERVHAVITDRPGRAVELRAAAGER